MKKNICCSVSEEAYSNLPKAKFILAEKKKTLSEVVAETINKCAKEYDETYKKV